jgi:UDP-N-acetylmuramoyl-tripeptide--D-alanyl-D-alanine ligase
MVADCLFVALRGQRFDAHQFLPQAATMGAAAAIVEQDVPLPPIPAGFGLLEVEDTLTALGELARTHRLRFRIPVAAVTGSNGKTTTKDMTAAILRTRGPALKTEGNLNNEVGLPLTLLSLEPAHLAAVVELGMNRAGEIARLTALARPDAGLITSVQPAHLEGLGTLEAVAAAKGELFAGLSREATAVVNLDDAQIVAQSRGIVARRVTFGRHPSADVRLAVVENRGRDGLAVVVRLQEAEYPFRLSHLGEHNALNATGAFALAHAIGFSPEECVRGLESARPHAHRLSLVQTPEGIWLLDDSYNANPASMAAALRTLSALAKPGRSIAVLGDMLELGAAEQREHQILGELAASHAEVVAFFGPRSAQAHRVAADGGALSAHFEDIDELVVWLRERVRPGDLVLLKGSRGMRLERVIQGLCGDAQTGDAHP